MTGGASLRERYHDYLACLNARDWAALGRFVSPTVRYNGEAVSLDGYRAMLIASAGAIPDLVYRVERLVIEDRLVAARLIFDCHPSDGFMDLAVGGRHVVFSENVFYRFEDAHIAEVWSVIDKAAVEAQIGA